MESECRICILVPVYNHGLTIQQVVSGARAVLPVIVVDDGSNDQTPKVLAVEREITLITLPRNQGKAAALLAGFAAAQKQGFTHAITIDADGQHPVSSLAEFAVASRRSPEAFIIGVRDLKAAGAPRRRRLSNALSTFWFRFETGVRLTDTQCGFRVYPLAMLSRLDIKSDRYAFELEIMVKAAWAGIPLISQPVPVDYEAPTSRLSHFHPLRDFMRITRVHSRLAAQAVWRRIAGSGNGRA